MQRTPGLLALLVVWAAVWLAPPGPFYAQNRQPPFSVVEVGIREMQAAMEEGRATSREIVQQSLTRLAAFEDRLNAAITVNPRALEDADALDRERREGRVRGPLHGIPIALKDNIHTTGMRTTAGRSRSSRWCRRTTRR